MDEKVEKWYLISQDEYDELQQLRANKRTGREYRRGYAAGWDDAMLLTQGER